MNKYIAEFIGTFFLVFTIGNVVIANSTVLGPVGIGAALVALVYACGHISGAHFNPAVTVALYVRGRCDTRDVGPYLGAQLLAAALAGSAVTYLKSGSAVTPLNLDKVLGQALVAEVLFTFALVWVILNVATAKGTEGNPFYGLAIGFTVLAGAVAVGGLSGGVFNPAVAVGLCVMGAATWSSLWIYLVANFAGGVAAAVVFKFVEGPDPTD